MPRRSRKGPSRGQGQPPLLVKQWSNRIRALEARPLTESVALPISRVRLATSRHAKSELQLLHTGQDAQLRLLTNVVGEHRFPPAMRHQRVGPRRRKRIDRELLSGFHPEFLARSALPKRLSRALRRAKAIDPKRRVGKGQVEITTVFAPDERYTFDGEDEQSTGGRDSYEINHKIDVFPGQSGGPYFGWWDSEPWPRVVSVQSGQNLGGAGGPNTCGGGDPLPELINYARTQDP